jgi:eukaryotic-like serine/threonine-protein kinase
MAADEQLPTYAELTQTHAWAGAPAARVAAPEPGAAESSSARYAETAVLGVGGMGKVVLARDLRIGREVAVKQLRSDRELSDAERDRFLREAHVQGQLEHPSIVPVYDIDRRADGTTFFTMRRVLGHTLHAILDELRAARAEAVAKYSQRELLQAFGTVCLAIDYAHSRGVVHRDLKPANIMLGDFGEVYVLDWGLARLVEPDGESVGGPAPGLSMPGTMMGTPLYMAPEQMADPKVDAAADVFSLGAILFEVLTLQRLRDARGLVMPIDARVSVRAPDRPIAPELEMICVRATQEEPGERFPSARALHDAVARFLEGDRELEQRRVLAAGHAARAKDALGDAAGSGADHERKRGVAMRELSRALALEPANHEHVAMLAEIMATPPRDVPPEIQSRVDAQTQDVLRAGSRHVMYSTLGWFLFLPLLLLLGVRRVDLVVLTSVSTAATVMFAAIATRQQPIGRAIQCAILAAMMVSGVALSRMFGPLILVPALMATWATVAQTHPDRLLRWISLVGSALVIALPVVLEAVGVLPASYVFEHGRLSVVPQMNELPSPVTEVFLTVAHLGLAVIPALFVARLRNALSAAQQRQLIQTWHFRRLGDDLLRAAR